MIGTATSPTLRAHSMLQQNVAGIKERLETARIEAVTGVAADIGRAVGGDTAKVNMLSEAIDYARDRTNVLDFEGGRMSTAQLSLEAIRGGTSGTLDALRTASNSTLSATKTVAQETARGALEDTVSRLNGSYGGRPLFGGDSGLSPMGGAGEILDAVRTIFAANPGDTTTALAEVEAWFDDPAGGFETAFFKGGDGDAPTVELDKGDRAATSVRGDDRSLRDTMRGLALAALAGEAPDDGTRDTMNDASEGILAGAGSGVLDLQSRLGVSEERVANALAERGAEVTTLSIAYNGLTGVDQAGAATEMRLLESQLEAAYLTTSRMASLTLTSYLR